MAATEIEEKSGDARDGAEDLPKGPPRSLLREYFESAVVVLVMNLLTDLCYRFIDPRIKAS